MPAWLKMPNARLDWADGSSSRPQPIALAIGMFDGVHLGHQSVIESAVATARHSRGLAAVLTFDPHPSRIFRPEEPTLLLMPPELKTREILSCGVGLLISKTFDAPFANLEADAFLPYLRSVLPTLVSIHIGENFRFGRGRSGDVGQMVKSARALDIDVFSVDRFRFNGEAVSSSRLRAALANGDIEDVNAMLGYDYYAEGVVVPGKRLGRTIGFPTLNVVWNPELKPRFGVYAVSVTGPDGAVAVGVANYGVRPTVEASGTEPRLEVHLLSETAWDAGAKLRVAWLRFLRDEQKFPSLDALKQQISADREAVQAFFSV